MTLNLDRDLYAEYGPGSRSHLARLITAGDWKEIASYAWNGMVFDDGTDLELTPGQSIALRAALRRMGWELFTEDNYCIVNPLEVLP